MSSRNITSLEALLEYAHKLPWGREEDKLVNAHLDGALTILDEQRTEQADVAPDTDESGVGQK